MVIQCAGGQPGWVTSDFFVLFTVNSESKQMSVRYYMMWHLQDTWKCSGRCHGVTKEEILVGRLIAKVQSVRIASVEQMG